MEDAARRFSEKFTVAGAAAGRSDSEAYWSTKLHLKIAEAKNLTGISRDGTSDPFVYIKVDDEIVARTSTIWKTTSPFWGEEFSLDVANDFQSVCIHVCSQDKSAGAADERLGIIDLARRTLEMPSSSSSTSFGKTDIGNTTTNNGSGLCKVDGWLSLAKPNNYTDVHGEVEVELLTTETDTGLDQLTVTVRRARDLLSKDTTTRCDPQCSVLLDSHEVTTEKVKNSRYPAFMESFTFQRAKLGPSLTITMRDASGGMRSGSSVLGEAVIKLDGLTRDIPKTQWYRLRPRASDLEKYSEGCGSLRITASLSNDFILPLPSYDALMSIVKAGIQTEHGIQTGVIHLLEDVIRDRESQFDREEIARTLIRVLLSHNSCVTFLRSLNGLEIQRASESSTLFRGNSLATKCTDQFMKITGLGYLHATMKSEIDRIFQQKKDCEIDPDKIIKKGDIQRNAAQLIEYLKRIFDSIFQSVNKCPIVMRMAFKNLQNAVKTNPNLSSGDTPYTVVSGFLFLRFFAPAVLAPKLFGMREELADARTSRTLTLLAKALQSVGNLGSTIGSGKEQYMAPLFPVIRENLSRIRQFIDELCTVDTSSNNEVDSNPALKSASVLVTGDLLIRIEKSGKSSFKKRTCILTHEGFRVHKVMDATSELLNVPIRNIHTVEQVEAFAFDRKHVITIQAHQVEPVYMYLGSAFETFLWLQGFRRATKLKYLGTLGTPSTMPSSYCPGAIVKGKTTCCKRKYEALCGCSKTHHTALVDQFLDSDPPELWCHKLFKMLMEGRPNMEATIQSGIDMLDGIDKERYKTIDNLLLVLDDINLAHLLYQDGGS